MKKTILTVLMAVDCMLGVFVWAEANSVVMFANADLREAKKTIRATETDTNSVALRAGKEVAQLFERTVGLERTAYATASWCGIGVVVLSGMCMLGIWLPPGKKPVEAGGASANSSDQQANPSARRDLAQGES